MMMVTDRHMISFSIISSSYRSVSYTITQQAEEATFPFFPFVIPFASGMSYNGVGLASIKGSGLSGYVQRSRVAAPQRTLTHQGRVASTAEAEDQTRTPLEAARTAQENAELAALLNDHDKRRAIRVKVMEYEIRRRAELNLADSIASTSTSVGGVSVCSGSGQEVDATAEDTILRECLSLKRTLTEQYEEAAKRKTETVRRAGGEQLRSEGTGLASGSKKGRDATTFAAAFGVTTEGNLGDAFNRHKQEHERQQAEAQRRAAAEKKLLDRVKRVRLEEASSHVTSI